MTTAELPSCNVCGRPDANLSNLGRCFECIRQANRHWEQTGLQGHRVTEEELEVVQAQREADPLGRLKLGGRFILDTPADPVPLWGDGQAVLWSEGESLVIVGPQGTGKSTIAQQLALRCALGAGEELLGYPVYPQGTVLYLAMDRPRQIARSFARMVDEADRQRLDDGLLVWEGPPLFDMAKDTGLLARMGELAMCRVIVVDSLKDAAIGLSDDEVGAGWNRARQRALQAGYEVVEVHHQRKAPQSGRGAPSLDDVYGSTWITSGAGSVVLLDGAPGDPIVALHHLKQPAAEVGPLRIIHDHEHGTSSVWHTTDLVALARQPITALDAAKALFETDKPTSAQREKARRRLDALVRAGRLRAEEGDKRTNTPARYTSADPTILDALEDPK